MQCKHCNKDINVRLRDQKQRNNHFCSQSCAAKFNNKIPGRKVRDRTSLRKCKNKDCTEMLYTNRDGSRVFCSKCIIQKKHYHGYDLSESTIEEVVSRQGSNTYDTVRAHCHGAYKSEKKTPLCQNCEYSKHIELCHIQPIASFPKDTKLKRVNARENILFLCPNCHWEFDHNMLTLEEIKNSPAWTRTRIERL